jgi:hypothetical protein
VRCERRKLDAPALEEQIRRDKESVGPVAHKGGKCRFDFVGWCSR